MARSPKGPKTTEDVRRILIQELEGQKGSLSFEEWRAAMRQIETMDDGSLVKLAASQGYKVKAPKAPKPPKQAPAAAPAVEQPIDMLAAQQMLGAAGGGMPMLPEPPTGWGTPIPEWERQALPLAEGMGGGRSPIDMLAGTHEMAGVPIVGPRRRVPKTLDVEALPEVQGPLEMQGPPTAPSFMDAVSQQEALQRLADSGFVARSRSAETPAAYPSPIGPEMPVMRDGPLDNSWARRQLLGEAELRLGVHNAKPEADVRNNDWAKDFIQPIPPEPKPMYDHPIGPKMRRIGKDPVKRAAAEKRLASRSGGSPLMKGLGAVGTAAGLAMGPLMLYQMLKGGDEPYQMPQDQVGAVQAGSEWRQMDRIQRALDDIGSGTGLPSEIDDLIAGHEQELQAARVPMPGPTLRQRYMAAGVL